MYFLVFFCVIEIDEFQKIVDGFILMFDKLGTEVEKQKMKAVGSRNLVQSMTKHKEAMQLQHHVLFYI